MKLATLRDLYADQLRDLFDAEEQLRVALPRLARAAASADLRRAFESHATETAGHVARLKHILERLDGDPAWRPCKAIESLIEECEEYMEDESAAPEVIDAALIAVAQKMEHHKIGTYGTVRTFAQMLGEDEAAQLLQETLDEAGEADQVFSELAERIDRAAAIEDSEPGAASANKAPA